MDPRLFRRVQRYGWDVATDAYHLAWVPLLQRLTHECVARARPRSGERVVDLATGTGVGAFFAAEAVGPKGVVTGLDISGQMVARATERSAARGPGAAAVRFERRDMEDTAAPDAGFDVAVVAFGLMYAADRRAAFAEIARILSPGGRVTVCVWGRRAACGWADIFPIVDGHVEGEVCPLFFLLGGQGALTFALDRAGFTEIIEERASLTLSWTSADEACRAALEGGPVALAWKRFSPAVREQVRRQYLASIEPFRRGERYEVPSEIVFATARKP